MKGLIKVGIIATRSMIPQTLKIYLTGLGEIQILIKYSIENTIVNPHSAKDNSAPYRSLMLGILSSNTTRTEAKIMKRRTKSKFFPARVDVPKMIVCKRSLIRVKIIYLPTLILLSFETNALYN